MLKKIRFNKKSMIRWKVYFDRSRMYVGYLQFFLIGGVFIQSFRDKPWGSIIFDYAVITIPVIFLLFIIFSLILGFIDSRLGFREEEMRNLSKSNPVMMEMLDELKALRGEIQELKKNQQ